MSRIAKILQSTLGRQAARFDLALIRGLFILLVFGWGVSSTIPTARIAGVSLGRAMLLWFYPASLLLLALVAGRLTRETVGDSASGFLSLIALSGTSATEWTLISFLQNSIGFLFVWMIRIPFLFLFFTLGGIRLETLLLTELLFLFLASVVLARSMILCHYADNRNTANWSGIWTIFFIEIILSAGQLLVGIMSLLGLSAPLFMRVVADNLYQLTLQNWYRSFNSGGLGVHQLWGYLLLYSLLTVYWLLNYRRHVFKQIGETPQPTLESKKEKTKTLKSRPPLVRCWDDALAWQSYVYYAGGHDNTTGRVILFGLAFVTVLFCAVFQFMIPLMVIVIIGSGIIFMNVMNSPSHCFDKEVKAKTLGSLVLTPHNGLDLYRGWRRGTLWLSIPDNIHCFLIMIVMFFWEPIVSYIILCVMLTIHCSGPLLMLSGLVPIRFKSLGTAFFVLFGLFITVGAGISMSWIVHPAAFPFAFLPLYLGFNYIILHYFVERWLTIKIADEV